MDELKLTLTTPRASIYSDSDLLGSFDRSLMQHNPTLGRTRGGELEHSKAREAIRMAWRRFIFAIVGGIAIVVPSTVIVLGKAPVKVLVVVPVAILAFSCAVALFSTTSPENLLAATGAYSAVLTSFMANYCQQTIT